MSASETGWSIGPLGAIYFEEDASWQTRVGWSRMFPGATTTRDARQGETMILGKLWNAIAAQFNKLANAIRGYDPIAEMQLEYDRSVAQLKEGREGLAQYRALVERVQRQVDHQAKTVSTLEAKVKAFLNSGDREGAAKFALDLRRAKEDLAENQKQLDIHEQAYQNNLLKIKHAIAKLEDVKHKISKYDADLKLSRAEAEITQIASQFNFNITTDFGQAEEMIQSQIDKNRGRVRVAADLSGEGIEDVKRDIEIEKTLAEDALKEFEREQGLATPETVGAGPANKQLGPATKPLEKLPDLP